MAKTKNVPVPEVGSEAPEFRLPGAQGGQLKLGMRTVRGPVFVAFFRGLWSEEDVEYFTALASKEDEINAAGATIVGIGVTDPPESREFVRRTGIHSYILYDSARVAVRDYGLTNRDSDHGETARPAAFLIAKEGKIVRAWIDERPDPAELLAKVTEVTGLPKTEEEGAEAESEKKPRARRRKQAVEGDAATEEPEAKSETKAEGASAETPGAAEASPKTADEEKPEQKKVSPEEREKRRAERKAARSKSDESGGGASGEATGDESTSGKPSEVAESEAGSEAKNSAEAGDGTSDGINEGVGEGSGDSGQEKRG